MACSWMAAGRLHRSTMEGMHASQFPFIFNYIVEKTLCVNVSMIPLTKVDINIIIFLRTQIYTVRTVLKGILSQGRQAL